MSKKAILTSSLILLFGASGFSQTSLGIYYFTDNGTACPHNSNTTVDVQPANATFSAFTSTGTTCAQSNYQFNNSQWNTASSIDLNEYNEFSFTASSGYLIDLTSISFGHRTNSPTFCNWHLRSSLDNFATDIFSGQTTDSWDYPEFILSGFNDLTQVTFRFYVTDISSSNDTWRQDDIQVFGTVSEDPSAGLNENFVESGIFPNPGNEELIIRSEREITEIEVYNLSGKLVLKNNINSQKWTTFDTQYLSSGYYRVLVKMGEKSENHSWVKQ